MQSQLDICSITRDIPVCPVLASDTYRYDFCALVGCLIANGNTSPNTRDPISSITLIRFDHEYAADAENIAHSYYRLRLLYPDIQVHGVHQLTEVARRLTHLDIFRLFRALHTSPDILRPGDTLFFIAAFQGNVEVMEELHSLGMDINHKHFDHQATALHLAAELGHTHVARWLLQKTACDVNVRRLDNGATPLDTAALCDKQDIVRLLVHDERINPNIVRLNGLTALDIATKKKHYQCMYEMLSNHNTEIGRSLAFAQKNQDSIAVDIILNCYLSRMIHAPARVNAAFAQYPAFSIDLLKPYRNEFWQKIVNIEGFELSEDFYDLTTRYDESGQAQQIKKVKRPQYAELLENIFFSEGSVHPLKEVILSAMVECAPAESAFVGHSVFATSSPASVTLGLSSPSASAWVDKIKRFIDLSHNDIPGIRLDF